MITPQQLAEWKALADAATPGPWHNPTDDGEDEDGAWENPTGDVGDDSGDLVAQAEEVRDAEFIAAARTAVPLLIERIAELEAEREAALRMLAEWCVAVEFNGTGWDDWDEHFKNANYRPGPLRAALDVAIEKVKDERRDWDTEMPPKEAAE